METAAVFGSFAAVVVRVVARHLRTASSSRQNDSDTNLPGAVMLSKRSIEMKPSNLLTSAFRLAARSR